jgi:predicted transcriptional regulator
VDVPDLTETSMQNSTSLASPDLTPSFVSRVINNDAVKKGLAGAAAGLLVAVVSEAIWPSR